jgi:hypothetical protein
MVTVSEDRSRFRQDPQQEQEWLRQLSLIYSGLIGIGVVMIQPFLTAASLDLTAKICVVAFSVAIPLLAALVVVNRQEVFRGRATPSVLASTARVVAQGSAFTGVVAGFWHILWIAGGGDAGLRGGGDRGALGGLVAPGTGPAGAAQGRRGTRRHRAIAPSTVSVPARLDLDQGGVPGRASSPTRVVLPAEDGRPQGRP